MTKIVVIIPSWNCEAALETIESLENCAKLSQSPNVEINYVISGDPPTSDQLSQLPHTISVIFVSSEDKLLGPVKNMRNGYVFGNKGNADIVVFCHDDVRMHEDWVTPLGYWYRDSQKVGLVGLHGAKGLGTHEIYRTPYKLNQLARIAPFSNMVNAELHGARIDNWEQAATVDGFFMAFTQESYKAMGGWEGCLADGIVFHMYDSWAAMRMKELGYNVYVAPVSVEHFGGRTEVGMNEQYQVWCKDQGFKDGTDLHEQMHKIFYERFRGKLPVRVD